MRLLVFAEYLFAGAWQTDAWIACVCQALASRGHAVTLACDGGKDLSSLLPCRIIVRRPQRSWRQSSPIAFSRWAQRIAAQTPHDASLSFTPLAPADATIPLGGPLATLRLMVGLLNPVAMGLELLHQPWLPLAGAVEAMSPPARCLRIGLPSGEPGFLGYASTLPWAGDEIRCRHQARSRVRSLLGIGLRRPVFLLSSVHPKRAGIEPMLHALAFIRADARPALAPVVLVVGPHGYSLVAAAARAGAADGLRILGGTSHMSDAIDASDFVLAPGAAPAPSTGRLIADALRRGRPVLADRHAPGADLLAPAPANGYDKPGVVVDRSTASAWRIALSTASDPGWAEAAGTAALRAGQGLTFDAVAERLEAAILDANARKKG